MGCGVNNHAYEEYSHKTLAISLYLYQHYLQPHYLTHPLNGPFPVLPRWAHTKKVKPIWILLKQVSGSGISWAACKSAPRSRQITMPATHRSVFLQAGCLSCRPTNSIKALEANLTIWQCLTNWFPRKIQNWKKCQTIFKTFFDNLEMPTVVMRVKYIRERCPLMFTCSIHVSKKFFACTPKTNYK